jgi:hypothetical protein
VRLRLRLRLRPRVRPRVRLWQRLGLRLMPKLARVHRVAAWAATVKAAAATMEITVVPPRRVCQHGHGRSLAGMHTVGRLPIGGYTQTVL